MKYNPKEHHRRSIRLKDYDYSQTGAYFITVCTYNKECLLGSVVDGMIKLSPLGKIVHEFWFEISKHFENVELGEFVVMPNHVHGIIIINNVGAIHELPLQGGNKIIRQQMLIPKIIGFYKMNAAKHINQFRNTPGASVWQRNYYEHIIRNEEDLNQIREYIINNPLEWELDEENPKILNKNMMQSLANKSLTIHAKVGVQNFEPLLSLTNILPMLKSKALLAFLDLSVCRERNSPKW